MEIIIFINYKNDGKTSIGLIYMLMAIIISLKAFYILYFIFHILSFIVYILYIKLYTPYQIPNTNAPRQTPKTHTPQFMNTKHIRRKCSWLDRITCHAFDYIFANNDFMHKIKDLERPAQ